MAAAQRWTLRGGVFLLPLVYSPATYDGYVLPKLLFARVLVVALLLLWLVRAAVTRTFIIKRTPLDVPLLLFLGSAALSTALAQNVNVAIFGTYERYDGLLTLFTYIALFWLSVQSLVDRAEAHALVRVVLATGYVVSAAAIVQSLHDSLQEGGIQPAFGSMGNPNVLGAFLALVVVVAIGELLTASSVAARIVIGNVLVISAVAVLLTFSRSTWLGALAGVIFITAVRPNLLRALSVALPVVAVVAVVIAVGYAAPQGQLERALVDRVLSSLDPRSVEHTRIGIWGDSLRLIADRPIAGFGPDNVGLVFPRFQTGDWGLTSTYGRQPIDKAHAELLQVAATQGLIGVATYLLVQVSFLRALWRARREDSALVAGAGWIAYQLVVQLNFTTLAAALPFWMFAAAAVWSCDAVRVRASAVNLRRGYVLVGSGVALAAAAAWWGAVLPFSADQRLREAVDLDYSGHPQEAQRAAAEAYQLSPRESVYAVEVGNTAFERGQWPAAREAYRAAAGLGTFNPLVYRNLALADRNLGLTAEARDAARKAVELDRFDPANQALLAELTTTP